MKLEKIGALSQESFSAFFLPFFSLWVLLPSLHDQEFGKLKAGQAFADDNLYGKKIPGVPVIKICGRI